MVVVQSAVANRRPVFCQFQLLVDDGLFPNGPTARQVLVPRPSPSFCVQILVQKEVYAPQTEFRRLQCRCFHSSLRSVNLLAVFDRSYTLETNSIFQTFTPASTSS